MARATKTSTSDDETPRRPPNSYFLYMFDFLEYLRLQSKNGPTNQQDNIKACSVQWRKAPEDLKRFYGDWSRECHIWHKRKYPNYKFLPNKSGEPKTSRSRHKGGFVPPVPPPYPRPGSFQESLSTYLTTSSSGGPSTPSSAERFDPQFIPAVITQGSSEYASQPPSRASTASTFQPHYVDEATTRNMWSQFPSVVSVSSQPTYTPFAIEVPADDMPDTLFEDCATELFSQPQETTQSASYYSYPPSDSYTDWGQRGSQFQFAVVQPAHSTEEYQYMHFDQPQISNEFSYNGAPSYEGGSYVAQPHFEVQMLPSYAAQAGPTDDEVSAGMREFWTPEMLGFSNYPAPSFQWDQVQAF